MTRAPCAQGLAHWGVCIRRASAATASCAARTACAKAAVRPRPWKSAVASGVVREALMQAGRGGRGKPGPPGVQLEDNPAGPRGSRKPAEGGSGPGLQPRPPAPGSLFPAGTARTQGRPPPAPPLRAGTCSERTAWTFRILPPLSLTLPPRLRPLPTTFLLTLSFPSCPNTHSPGQTRQLARCSRLPRGWGWGRPRAGLLTEPRPQGGGRGAETGSRGHDRGQPAATPPPGPSQRHL